MRLWRTSGITGLAFSNEYFQREVPKGMGPPKKGLITLMPFYISVQKR
jgi:hypothetical protein